MDVNVEIYWHGWNLMHHEYIYIYIYIYNMFNLMVVGILQTRRWALAWHNHFSLCLLHKQELSPTRSGATLEFWTFAMMVISFAVKSPIDRWFSRLNAAQHCSFLSYFTTPLAPFIVPAAQPMCDVKRYPQSLLVNHVWFWNCQVETVEILHFQTDPHLTSSCLYPLFGHL